MSIRSKLKGTTIGDLVLLWELAPKFSGLVIKKWVEQKLVPQVRLFRVWVRELVRKAQIIGRMNELTYFVLSLLIFRVQVRKIWSQTPQYSTLILLPL